MDDPDGTNAQVDAILSQTSTTKQIKRAQLHDEWQVCTAQRLSADQMTAAPPVISTSALGTAP